MPHDFGAFGLELLEIKDLRLGYGARFHFWNLVADGVQRIGLDGGSEVGRLWVENGFKRDDSGFKRVQTGGQRNLQMIEFA